MISLAIQKQKRRRKNEEQEILCVACAIYPHDEGESELLRLSM